MFKIDFIDKKILKELSTNSRRPVSKIAQKIKVSRGRIWYRIKNLEKLGIIKKFTTIIDTNALGFGHYNINLNLIKANFKKRDEIINYLRQNFPLVWIGSSVGAWDICLDYVSKENNFEKLVKDLIEKHGNFIRRYDLIQIKKMYIYPQYPDRLDRDYKPLKKEEIFNKEINKTDYLVLQSIKSQANKSLITIARENSLSIDVVKYSLKRLINQKVILGFHIDIDLSKIGYDFFMLRIRLNNFDESLMNSIVSFSEKYPGLHYIFIDRFSPTIEVDISMRERKEFEIFLMNLQDTFYNDISEYRLINLTKSYGVSYLPDNIKIEFK